MNFFLPLRSRYVCLTVAVVIISLLLVMGHMQHGFDRLTTLIVPTTEYSSTKAHLIQNNGTHSLQDSEFMKAVIHWDDGKEPIWERAILRNDDKANDFLLSWGGLRSFSGGYVKYARADGEILSRKSASNCSTSLQVLEWVTNEVQLRKGALVVAYGSLLHVFRERHFIDNHGTYHDDDIDMWASAATARFVLQLEPELFRLFGWTMRSFISAEGYVIFLQMMPSCGHEPVAAPSKVESAEPAIELYLLSVVQKNGVSVAKDLWNGSNFSKSMIYPTTTVKLPLTGGYSFELQVPGRSLDLLDCMYGNWSAPSSLHAELNKFCKI